MLTMSRQAHRWELKGVEFFINCVLHKYMTSNKKSSLKLFQIFISMHFLWNIVFVPRTEQTHSVTLNSRYNAMSTTGNKV